MQRARWFGALLGAAAAAGWAGEREASACGGVFTPPAETEAVITDHRMVLSISKTQTTLYDQVEYRGSPSSFAWVLPIKGTATVGLSSDLLFDTLDALTAPLVLQPVPDCPAPPPGCDVGVEGGAAGGDDAGGSGVTVTGRQQVGPYETVQLHSSDASALNTWLTSNGYDTPSAVAAVISAYVNDGFDFLAMKLAPGATVKAMRPVRVTTAGGSLVLPLRMVAAGTGATTGITLWIAADGRYEPQNFPSFVVKSSDLTWDWTTSSSNYDAVRKKKEAALGGEGWQIESSIEINQDSVRSTLLDSVDVAADGGAYPPVDAASSDDADDGEALDASLTDASDRGILDASPGDGGGSDTAQADLDVLFAGIALPNVRITRMRGDIAHAALANDLTLRASSDSSELSNEYTTSKQTGQPVCPDYSSCEASKPDASTNPKDEGKSGGCRTARAYGGPDALFLGFAGFAGLRFIRSRRKRAKT